MLFLLFKIANKYFFREKEWDKVIYTAIILQSSQQVGNPSRASFVHTDDLTDLQLFWDQNSWFSLSY